MTSTSLPSRQESFRPIAQHPGHTVSLKTPTVFMVDADPASCRTVRKVASMMNLPCETFTTGQDFLAAYHTSRTGCLLLEMRIPGLSGRQIQEYLAVRNSLLPIVFLGSELSASIAVRVMRSGAINVLEKPLQENVLWDAIEEGIYVNWRRLESQARRSTERARIESLTEKERQVLLLLAEGKSKRAIAQELAVCPRTVETRRRQLVEKLGADRLIDLMRFALLIGDGDNSPTQYQLLEHDARWASRGGA